MLKITNTILALLALGSCATSARAQEEVAPQAPSGPAVKDVVGADGQFDIVATGGMGAFGGGGRQESVVIGGMAPRQQQLVSHSFEIEADGEKISLQAGPGSITVLINNKTAPADRYKKTGDSYQLLSKDGKVIGTYKTLVYDVRGWRALEVPKARPYLGVTFSQPDEALAEQLNVNPASSAIISSVVEGSAAEKAGLKRYDVIIKVDDNEPASESAVRAAIAKKKPGENIKLTILRKQAQTELVATLGEATEPISFPQIPDLSDVFNTHVKASLEKALMDQAAARSDFDRARDAQDRAATNHKRAIDEQQAEALEKARQAELKGLGYIGTRAPRPSRALVVPRGTAGMAPEALQNKEKMEELVTRLEERLRELEERLAQVNKLMGDMTPRSGGK